MKKDNKLEAELNHPLLITEENRSDQKLFGLCFGSRYKQRYELKWKQIKEMKTDQNKKEDDQ
jgi:hypothetical protein